MPTIPNEAHAFDLDGRTVLFEELSTKLYVLNDSASAIWERLIDGDTPDRIATELSRQTNAPHEQVTRDIAALLSQWEADGLVTPTEAIPARESNRTLRRSRQRQNRRAANDRDVDLVRARAVGGTYKLADYVFRLSADADIGPLCNEVIGHLKFEGEFTADELPQFALHRRDDRWTLRNGKRLLAQCTAREEIAPMLHANILAATYHGSNSIAAIHAAAVSNGTDCVLLPAASGGGKSTLTAALVADGFGYCTDDLALLTPPPIRLRTAPLCIGLKSGSWDQLGERIPAIADLPAYRREDKKRIRYLLPPGDSLPRPENTLLSVKAMIFPEYRADAGTQLTSIERGDAFLKMLHAGYDLRDDLDHEWVRNMVSWIKTFPSYELNFDNLDDAVDAVKGVL